MAQSRWIWIFSAALAAAAACGTAARKHAGLPGAAPALAARDSAAETAVQTPVESGELAAEPSARNASVRRIAELRDVHFNYDKAELDADALAVLKENAGWLRDHPGVLVQVAGFCDQRGTISYNLALGQRRAKAVRDYYAMLDVPASRVSTISYGKERLSCQEATEACWKRNRRAETLGLNPGAVSFRP